MILTSKQIAALAPAIETVADVCRQHDAAMHDGRPCREARIDTAAVILYALGMPPNDYASLGEIFDKLRAIHKAEARRSRRHAN